ncbi:MAG: type II and III secretion system protein family protein [Minwuiales bacterium]|nr:type II and III secretion system protein family protein [Minwuiales bacterium]
MWRSLIALAAAAVISTSGVRTAHAAAEVVVSSSGSQLVDVELSEGQLIRLSRPANAMFVANAEIADINVKSQRLVYVFGKKPGQTTLYALDAKDNVIANIKIKVSHNISQLNSAINQIIPGGRVNAMSVSGGIMLNGSVNSADDAENLLKVANRFLAENESVINRVSVTESNQVNLRVRIAEVSRDVVREFGLSWEGFAEIGDFLFGVATGTDFVPDGVTDGTAFIRPEGNAFFGSFNNSSVNVNTLIDSMAEDGLVNLLAEPNLTAISGETASFLAGGEFPIPMSREEDSIGIEFKQFGVSLAFTPTVLDGNRISMRVKPEVSQLSNNGAIVLNGFQIPALTTRRTETTVELASGQSFAIAGMLQDRDAHDISEVPGLSEVPILGRLFTSERFQREETELVIIVTPYLVRPQSQRQLVQTPSDQLFEAPPKTVIQEANRSLRQAVPLAAANNLRPGLVGPAGFLIE